MGATLSLLAALYEDDIAAVAAQRGLAGYLSILDDAFCYTPADLIVPRILEVGDIADIAAAVAPRSLLVEGLVNGRNELLSSSELEGTLSLAREAYRRSRATDKLALGAEPRDAAAWLIARLK
jgi:hypothetical protein